MGCKLSYVLTQSKGLFKAREVVRGVMLSPKSEIGVWRVCITQRQLLGILSFLQLSDRSEVIEGFLDSKAHRWTLCQSPLTAFSGDDIFPSHAMHYTKNPGFVLICGVR